jgi:hypothetical protein
MTYAIRHPSQDELRAATFAEARRQAIDVIVRQCVALESEDREHAWPIHDLCRAVGGLPEAGGTVGPLPDGTFLEVDLGWSLECSSYLNPEGI